MPVRWHSVGLVLGDPLLAAGHQLAELVELAVIAGADEAAVAGHERAVVDERRLQRTADVGAQVEPLFQLLQQCAGAAGELGLDLRQDRERAADEAQVARARPAGGHAGQQPLDVVDLVQRIRGARR